MEAGERLSYYIELQGFTKKSFCEKNELQYGNFTTILTNKRPLGVNILNIIHKALPKLNVHWVLYGEGKMEIEDTFENMVSEPAAIYETKNDTFEFMLLKYLDNEKIKNKIKKIANEK